VREHERAMAPVLGIDLTWHELGHYTITPKAAPAPSANRHVHPPAPTPIRDPPVAVITVRYHLYGGTRPDSAEDYLPFTAYCRGNGRFPYTG